MYERSATIFVYALEIYAAVGLLFAIVFVSIGVTRIDREAQGTKLGFRLIILPSVAAFWPLLLKRWLSGASEPQSEKNPHR
jgi:hypothetical protein